MVKRYCLYSSETGSGKILVVVMRDYAGENKLNEIMESIQSTGARNHFSSAYEQWQNGLAGAVINSIMRLARTGMAESGLGVWF